VSKRFRKQLVYVLIKIHISWLQTLSKKGKNNQITPSVELVIDGQVARADITVHDIVLQTL